MTPTIPDLLRSAAALITERPHLALLDALLLPLTPGRPSREDWERAGEVEETVRAELGGTGATVGDLVGLAERLESGVSS